MPNYWGSALRGGLGKWLKKVTCVLRHTKCRDCPIRNSCAHGYIFETESIKPSSKQTINARPHPIVLQLPYPTTFSTNEGDSFSFSIILIDMAQNFLPHIIYSLTKLGKEDGIGAKAKQGFGRFEITSIKTDELIIYEKGNGDLTLPESSKTLDISNSNKAPVSNIEVHFLTPLRVKYKGKFQNRISFQLLLRTALRRISSLETFYGNGEPELDHSNLIYKAYEVDIQSEELKWQEVPRYSSRQKQKMMIGGVVGKVQYHGELEQFLPFLKYCEAVHLGKQTFFGLGKIQLENKENH